YNSENKWHTLSSHILREKIGVLCTQEMHLSDEQTKEINRFHNKIKIFSSSSPNLPNAQGVTIVINKRLIKTENIKTTNVIDGRVILAKIPWLDREKLTILTVYTPNNTTQMRTSGTHSKTNGQTHH
ncbi:hypothetical protein P691DRAFT_682851, partial [Macrolepiota fuliginosa MF-IS2]